MSPFTFGFVTTDLHKLSVDHIDNLKSGNSSSSLSPEIRIWTLANRTNQLEVNGGYEDTELSKSFFFL